MKKGLELSMTVLVVIILSIIIFIGGVTLVYKFFTGAEELEKGISKQTQDQIEAMLTETNQIVAIPFNKQTVKQGKWASFGVGIRNIAEKENFRISLAFAGAYDLQGKNLDAPVDDYFIEENWLGGFKDVGPIAIERNKIRTEPIKIKAFSEIAQDARTPQGNYAFYVCVFKEEQLGQECVPGAEVYDTIKMITVEVR